MFASAQSSEITFELHSLGWKAFQDLCATVLGEVLGQTIEVFLPSKDGGRDGAFNGKWTPAGEEVMSGSFTMQCKFTSKRDHSLSINQLNDELEKAKRLAKRGLATNYILMTNHFVSGTSEEAIRRAFLEVPEIQQFRLYGYNWINLKIRESSRLRMLVPRVYGLGDISQIIDERARSQAQEILISMGSDLAKFVMTESYEKSARALLDHGFVLLLGEPASGKSTIAANLAIGAADLWGCSIFKIGNADDFVRHWNPNERRQFFWVDDTFGTTQYQRSSVDTWNGVFPHMAAAIKKGARVLFTSRDYIYRAALYDLKRGAFPLIDESQVIINVQDLSKTEKEQILYNHIKMGDQPVEFRKKIKPYLPGVANSPRFLPEVARRLGNRFFTRNLIIQKESVMNFVEQPVNLLADVIRSLDRRSLGAISLIFMNGGELNSPIQPARELSLVLNLLGLKQADISTALQTMQGSLVKYVLEGSNAKWKFKHPTIGDALASVIADNHELLDIYLAGTPVGKLVEEVVCGNVKIEGAKVVVPENRYSTVIESLRQLSGDKLYSFLANRCDGLFLEQYVKSYPSIFQKISSPNAYLSASQDVFLLSRLHEFELLPDEWRSKFIDQATEWAVEVPDVDFLTVERIRSIFKESEIKGILDRVRTELLPNLSNVVSDWRLNYSGQYGDPGAYFEPLRDALTVLKKEFAGDKKAKSLINAALPEIDDDIEYLRGDSGEHEDNWDEEERFTDHTDPIPSDRDIFDDVDE